MPASVPTSDSGAERLGISVAGRLRRKMKITSTTSATDEAELEFDIGHRSADGHGLVGEDRHVDPWRQRLRRAWATCAFTASTTAMTFEPGWRWTLRMIAGVLLAQAAEFCVFRALDHLGDIGKPDRGAIPVGDDETPVLLGRLHLVIVVDGRILRGAIEIALRQIGVLVGDVGADVVDRQAIGRERARVDFDAQGRALAAGNRHQADAGNLGQFLRQPYVGNVLDLGQRQGLGGDGEDSTGVSAGLTLA